MYADGSSYANGNIVGLEREYLSEGANVKPFFARRFCVCIFIFCLGKAFQCSVTEAGVTVFVFVIRLNEDVIAEIHHAVAYFSFYTYVGNFTEIFVVGSRSVAVERISVRISHSHGQKCREVDFMVQYTHCSISFSSVSFIFSLSVPFLSL